MNMTLAERIKLILKERNTKQVQFARALGISSNYSKAHRRNLWLFRPVGQTRHRNHGIPLGPFCRKTGIYQKSPPYAG